jgi:hypothetical protein
LLFLGDTESIKNVFYVSTIHRFPTYPVISDSSQLSRRRKQSKNAPKSTMAFIQRGVLAMQLENNPLTIPELQLPKPEIPEADENNVLDLTMHLGDATAIVKKWAAAHIWLRLVGQSSLKTPLIINILEDHELSTLQFDNGLLERLPRSQLMALAHNSTATLECFITFDGSSDVSTATAFPLLPLTIKTQLDDLDELTDFDDQTLGGWTKGRGGREIEFFIDRNGGFFLSNDTLEPVDNYDGMILEKTFSVIPGMTYEFTVDVKNNNPSHQPLNHPILLLVFDGIGPTHTISNSSWKNIASNRTVAKSETVTVSLRNLTRQWDGNDFSLDNFRVRRVQ